MAALFAAFPGRLEYHEPYHLDRLVTHILRGQIDLVAAQTVLDTFDPPLTIVDNGVIRPWKHALVDVTRIHSYHVMPRGVTKVGAILGDLEERGFTPSQALGAGDSLTDLEMAPAVGLLALVRNALEHPEMTERAASRGNVVVTDGACGIGWAELAHAWVDARANASCGVG
jgi:hydroxymethylpyrimidine pyrophosphatase-like HAD family hydrolase